MISILSEDQQSAVLGLGQMASLIVSISMGVLLGMILVSPNKFIPVTTLIDQPLQQKG